MRVSLKFRSYIASPYWPALEKLVNIQKQSGMNRVRSEDKRETALLRYLEKLGVTADDYKKLEKDARQPWYRNAEGAIIVPSHQLSAALVHASESAPAGARVPGDQLRCLLRVSDLTTERKEKDRLFERFIMPKDGKGNPLSNQRRYSVDEVIEDFEAVGSIEFDTGDVNEKTVRELLAYTGKFIGVGGCRKMGYGRFVVQ